MPKNGLGIARGHFHAHGLMWPVLPHLNSTGDSQHLLLVFVACFVHMADLKKSVYIYNLVLKNVWLY